MDKNAIKKYAVWARRELIARVSQKAAFYGITEEECVDVDTDSINGRLLSPTEKKQRQALIGQIKNKGYQEVMEEVAYTWFNRFSALRFMEVNGYLPTHVRVFTDEDNNFKPQILAEAIHLEMDGLDMEKVFAYKDEGKTDELYKYLLITQCNALNPILPGMFQKISDFTELLFPDNLLRDESVIEQMIVLIPEDDWKDAVQIIGWLYQYYNSEKKDEVFAALKKNVKITKENVPAATQLFTPEWIVRYMVENSLGRLWLEGHPNDELKSEWKYYLDEAEQEPDVQVQLEEIRKEYAALKPEDIKCIDPCCGSGHILAYLFDVLVKIYEAYGYTTREAVSSIVENNIYGLDIDDRAAQLANFVVMMKARQYDHRFFSRGIHPNVYAIVESNYIGDYLVDYFSNGDNDLKKATDTIIDELCDAKEYGSILTVTQQDWNKLYERFEEIYEDINMCRDTTLKVLFPLIQVAKILASQYDTVITNPPYMGNSGMSIKLSNYVKKIYPDSKTDLFSVFIEKSNMMTKENRYQSMITQHGWMFLSSFEKLRVKMLKSTVINLVHLGARAFEEISGEVVQTASYVFFKHSIPSYVGSYSRLVDGNTQSEKERLFCEKNSNFFTKQDNYKRVPGYLIAYWISNTILDSFSDDIAARRFADFRHGMSTSDNNRFLRYWFEIDNNNIGFEALSKEDTTEYKWFIYLKGGTFRKWYGNYDYVVNWHNDGYEIKKISNIKYPYLKGNLDFVLGGQMWFFKPGYTWSSLTSGNLGIRKFGKGCIFDAKGQCFFTQDETIGDYLQAFFNSKVFKKYGEILAPTLDFNSGVISKAPVIIDEKYKERIGMLVNENVKLSKMDWDSFEKSWNFQTHPLIRDYWKVFNQRNSFKLSDCFSLWEDECIERYDKLKQNEEELNSIFTNIYDLNNELTSEVDDKEVTVRKADLQTDIKSLISYAIGCMFGRYSLYNDGLLFAGGAGGDYGSLVEKIQDCLKEQNLSMFPPNEFYPDKDNIIPICDDEYFKDDIVTLFIKFIETVYGTETLDENMKFIADALGGKGQPKEVIQNYFLNDFFTDHCKTYQKRPIYWLFDSGKKNGFKALIYMHRYQPDTIARIRTDYVHEQQSRYRTAIADLEKQIANADTSNRVKLNKQLKKLQEQSDEIHVYEEKIHHLADQMISIDLDDGVKVNYAKFQDVLAKIK